MLRESKKYNRLVHICDGTPASKAALWEIAAPMISVDPCDGRGEYMHEEGNIGHSIRYCPFCGMELAEELYPKSRAAEVLKPLLILNSPIVTADGDYSIITITADDARPLVEDGNFVSAIGHQAAADVLSALLGVSVPCNRVQVSQKPGQYALIFRVSGRLPEGAVLTVPELERIGYTLQLLERKA